ncbi:biotin synthase BioB [Arthrobacter sp. A2-55]|uniref:biotin synthase BioB n=1 Tax=Arthrobacter sp. A2-55 TaxID=2897337 RepID=UPI0021CD1EED|nr:biotin synthase BioB [Arthrobacter sp. A2-55]MCU6479994.1 biotin synthase BioB [Arthrobacter sp. A2-55]
MFNYFQDLADRQLSGATLTSQDALAVLESTDAQLLDVVAAASRLRRAYFDNSVKVNYLVNLKSGLCPEDCTYCSQRLGSAAQILKYTWLKPEEALAQAASGIAAGASRVCLVASGKGPTDRDVDRVAGMVDGLKDQHPDVEVCACLGILKDGQAERLKASGVDAYNHNLNTSEARYQDICSTHEFSDRVRTVEHAKSAGLSPCSGLIVGMGESNEDLVDAVFALRELDSDSIPVNFLMPFDGTPLEGTWLLTPAQCVRILALVRFACPAAEIRMAGGREMHLRSLQPLALNIANSLFLGDYLTSEGQPGQADLDMIADAGFTVLGQGAPPQSAGASMHDAGASPGAPVAPGALPAIRRRGAGTTVAPNA